MLTLAAGLFVLTAVVSIHEFAHLLVAKWYGVKVPVYSIGFGPKLFGLTIGETEYRISAIPLGGYVRLAGHQDSEEERLRVPSERLFSSKTVWQRIAIGGAGPVSNYLLAMAIFVLFNFFVGFPVSKAVIGKVLENSPASRAGLRDGDWILAVGDKKIENWQEFQSAVAGSGGQELVLKVERGDSGLEIRVKPELKTAPLGNQKVWAIGVLPNFYLYENPYQPIQSVTAAGSELYRLTLMSLAGLWKLATLQSEAKDNFTGPILIVAASGQAAKLGLMELLHWLGLISFAIGFMNFLPIPVLDGGHLALFTLEIIRGKPLRPETEKMILGVGVYLLLMLAGFILYWDIMRIVNK